MRPLTSVRLQLAFAQEQGVAAASCLAGTGISEAALADPDAIIEASQELRFIENLCAHLPAPVLQGLAMGQRYLLSSYGPWGFALLSSKTFRDAVELGLRYLSLTYSFMDIQLEEDPAREEVSLVLDVAHLPPITRPYLLGREASAIMVIQEALFGGRLPLLALEFALPPQPSEPFRAIFDSVPRFNCTRSRAIFSADLLAMPLPQANPVTARLCEEQCQLLLAKRDGQGQVTAAVRQHLLRQPGYFPSMEEVADGLAVSTRTLRRQLLREDTHFQAVIDGVRRMLAEQWLATDMLALDAIALRLGYTDTSNFIHAFRRWTGATPAKYRRDAKRHAQYTQASSAHRE